MIRTLAIFGYRSLQNVVLELGQINLITGPNGSGKSSIYRSLNLLADTARGNLITSLAKEGGLTSTLWAGPEKISREVALGIVPFQGAAKRTKPVALALGFASDDFTYTVELGLPVPGQTAFGLDPIIKRECAWLGCGMNKSSLCADRRKQTVRSRNIDGEWIDLEEQMPDEASMLTEFSDPRNSPELFRLRHFIQSWRFYDNFRTDADAPARRAEVATRTPVLANDGANLPAALQTIRENGDAAGLKEAIHHAFPECELEIQQQGIRLHVCLQQHGLLRELSVNELSDGTLRYLLLAAALLSPRPPRLLVLNEPETSLHPDLIPALGKLIVLASHKTQLIVVTHSAALIKILSGENACSVFQLEKMWGATQIVGRSMFDIPKWDWPKR